MSLLAVAAGSDAELIVGLKKAESEIFVLLEKYLKIKTKEGKKNTYLRRVNIAAVTPLTSPPSGAFPLVGYRR